VDELKAIRAFVQVGREASFSAAARYLGRDQSVINRQVTALEERLGRKLVQRVGKKVELTEDGLTYFQHAAEVLEAFDRAEDSMGRTPESSLEVLDVQVTPFLASVLILPLLQDMRRRLPRIGLNICTSDIAPPESDQVLKVALGRAQLEWREADAGVQLLGPHRWILLGNPECIRHFSAAPDELLRRPFELLLLSEDAKRGPWAFRRDGVRVPAKYAARLTTDDPKVLLQAAARGQGVALIPWFLAMQQGMHELAPLFLDWQLEPAGGPLHVIATYSSTSPKASLVHLAEFIAGALRAGIGAGP
jgi:DNA-binding transcriptional LysR family regulator